jgi:V-type H+-transporting ATPase subunit a
MALGVLMKALNAIQYNKKIDFFFEFVPQIVLLIAMFGFMDLLIVVKWLTNYELIKGAKPPSVITAMITMFLGLGEQSGPVYESELIPNQPVVMKTLVYVSLICVPIMLFVKPIYEHMSSNSKHQH